MNTNKEVISFAPATNQESAVKLEETFKQVESAITSAEGLDDPKLKDAYAFRDKIALLLTQMNNTIPE